MLLLLLCGWDTVYESEKEEVNNLMSVTSSYNILIHSHTIIMTQNDDTLIIVKFQGKLEVSCSIHT